MTREKPDPETLLRISDHFLRRRYFSDCRTYLNQLLQSNPNFTNSNLPKMLTIADVLIASKHMTLSLTNYYDVMQVKLFTNDNELLTKQFNKLYGLLNPKFNKYAFADEALNCVCDAYYVLSDRVRKLEFDEKLRKEMSGEGEFTVWTVCPYCYYCYEYPRVYLDECMNCCNEKCGRVFTCVEIGKPPSKVLGEGKYVCSGFLSCGVSEGEWSPFRVGSRKKVEESGNGNGNGKGKSSNIGCEFVEISDDDEGEGKSGKSSNVGGEGDVNGGVKVKTEEGEDVPVKKVEMRRRKSLAKRTKVTGAGKRVREEGFVHSEEKEEKGTDNEYSSEYFGGSVDPMNGGDFYDADYDTFVSLQNGI